MESSFLAPPGKLVIGHVLDCNKASLERELKFYDKQLYLKWNPKKRGGWGCWEVRRKPEYTINIYQGKVGEYELYTVEHKELDIINHVLDLPYLSRNTLGKLKQMDTWNNKQWAKDLEYTEAKMREREEKKALDEMKYNIKQHKQEWRDFAKFVSEGGNPGQVLAKAWGK
jgi:hypothetical protein